ncbi:MAG: hypothetical protein V4635_06375 [Bacteroidota bacterium]
MTTLTKTYSRFDTNTQTISLASRYNQFIKKIEFSYFGIISGAILFSSCLGSIATMKIFESAGPLWMFILSLSVTMANLVACISQAPLKWVVNLFTLSIVVNTLLLLVNVL